MSTEQRDRLFHIHNMDRYLERLVDELRQYDTDKEYYKTLKNEIDELVIELAELTAIYEEYYGESVNLYLKNYE